MGAVTQPSCHRYLLKTYSVLGTVVVAGETAVKKERHKPLSRGAHFLGRGADGQYMGERVTSVAHGDKQVLWRK